jgi:hypothetical protein
MSAKVLQLLDVIAVEVAANRTDTAELRAEMRSGFNRVDRRLGNLENRVGDLETQLRSFRGEFDRRITALER